MIGFLSWQVIFCAGDSGVFTVYLFTVFEHECCISHHPDISVGAHTQLCMPSPVLYIFKATSQLCLVICHLFHVFYIWPFSL